MTENIKVYTQNSISVQAGNRKVYIDPFQMKESPKDGELVLITHDHYDHFSPEDIAKVVGADAILVVPEKMKDKAQEVSGFFKQIVTVRPGESSMVDGLEMETVPAYNILKPFHPKSAEWVGYILTIGEKRIYIAGDTDATKEAKAVKCDIALVPIGGTYTMDAKKAAELINTIRPQVVIPVHYGTIVGKASDAEVFKEAVDEGIHVEIRL